MRFNMRLGYKSRRRAFSGQEGSRTCMTTSKLIVPKLRLRLQVLHRLWSRDFDLYHVFWNVDNLQISTQRSLIAFSAMLRCIAAFVEALAEDTSPLNKWWCKQIIIGSPTRLLQDMKHMWHCGRQLCMSLLGLGMVLRGVHMIFGSSKCVLTFCSGFSIPTSSLRWVKRTLCPRAIFSQPAAIMSSLLVILVRVATS